MTIMSGSWDVHHHWVNEFGYIDRLLRTMDQVGVARTGLIALGDLIPELFILHGPRNGCVDNVALGALIKQHPDRFWGWGFIRLGDHKVEDVDKIAELGLAGLKFHAPLKPYDDPEFFPVYERAQTIGMPCLFHTGIFTPPKPMPGQRFRSENCRPVYLETIAQEYPKLKIICAHFGVCWNEEASAICRICDNIFGDLSGSADGWRSNKSIEWFKQTLYWPTAHKKIMFGSDVYADELAHALSDQQRIFRDIGWTKDQIQDVLCNNAKRLFGEP